MDESTQIINLLSDIKNQLGDGGISNIKVALIASGGVLAGSLLTGLFQYFNSKLSSTKEYYRIQTQLKAEIISRQRQEWMDSIREAAKDLLAEYDLVYNLISDKSGNQAEIIKLFLSTSKNAIFIDLKLNIAKPKQKSVADSMLKLQMHLQKHDKMQSADDDDIYQKLREDFIYSLTSLFSETWQRIKTLEG